MSDNKILEKFKINKEKWLNYGQWEQPIISSSFWVHWHDKEVCKKLGIVPLEGGVIMANGNTLVNRDDLAKLKKQFKKACANKNRDFFSNLLIVSQQIFRAHRKLEPILEKQFLKQSFEEFLSSSLAIMNPWYLGVIYSDYIGDLLTEAAKKEGVNPIDVFESIGKVNTLMIAQYCDAQKIKRKLRDKIILSGTSTSINKIIFETKKNPELWKLIESHLEKNKWSGTHHFWGEPLTEKKLFFDLLQDDNVSSKTRKKIFGPDIEFLKEVARDMAYLRQYSAEIFDLIAYRFKPLMKKISRVFGVEYVDLLKFSPREIIELLTNMNFGKVKKIKARTDFVFMLDNQCGELIIDDKLSTKKIIKCFVEQHNLAVDKFTGTVANAGCARGRVKVFLVPENIAKMKKGDILVTPMTTPDFIPLMQISGAVVTDIGGLLSHAAIVSREMNVPCIIGTKIATKVLKDGDLVEVDADKGIVKIIS